MVLIADLILLPLAGLIKFNILHVPKVIRNIKYFDAEVEFIFWILAIKVFVTALNQHAGGDLDIGPSGGDWWPAYIIGDLSCHLNDIQAILYCFLAIAGFLAVLFTYKKLINTTLGLFLLLAFLILLWNVFTMNALQDGLREGFMEPISAGKIQYYHDVATFDSVSDIVGDYNQVQESLKMHSQSHPFGPVFVLFILNELLNGDVFYISIIIAVLSCAAVFPTYLLLKELQLSQKTCRALLLIFAFIPSVIIYYGTTIDGIIALFFTTAIATFIYSFNRNSSIVALVSGIFISLALLMTFLGIFLIGVICIWFLVYNIGIAKRQWFFNFKSLAIILLFPITTLLLIKYLLGFDYAESFLSASRFENPDGFRLFSEPLSYLFTRLEDVWEILLFFGPVCSVLLFRSIKANRLSLKHSFFATVGISLLLVIFLSGALRTGETARACLFILPYLLLPIANQFEDSERDSRTIIAWLFPQALVMQILFDFFW